MERMRGNENRDGNMKYGIGWWLKEVEEENKRIKEEIEEFTKKGFGNVINKIYINKILDKNNSLKNLLLELKRHRKRNKWNYIRNNDYSINKNKLPKHDGKYLCLEKGYKNEIFIDIMGYSNDLQKIDKYDFVGCSKCGFYNSYEEGFYEVTDIIAWMYLPKYPKKYKK